MLDRGLRDALIWLAFLLRVVLQLDSSTPVDPNLVENVQKLAPTLDPGRIRTQIEAATNAAHASGIPVEQLLGQAHIESRFDPTATSRVVGTKRVTGSSPSLVPAGVGPRFCGPLQTTAGASWLVCLAMRVPAIGYWIGASELRVWLRAAHGDMRAALNGYGCGWRGLTNGCNGYADRVLAWSARIAGRSS